MTVYALVGASDFNGEHFTTQWREGAFDRIIAVDGGLASLQEVGCTPDEALGDFDSLGYVPTGLRTVRFPPEKDASDMQLALERAVRQGASAVAVYGALGRRLDHTLANLQLFAAFAEQGVEVVAVGDHERVTFLVGPGELLLEAADGGIVSVFSLTDVSTGVYEEGLRYGLDDATLTNRTSWGLSNEFAGTAARISVTAGTLAIFLPL